MVRVTVRGKKFVKRRRFIRPVRISASKIKQARQNPSTSITKYVGPISRVRSGSDTKSFFFNYQSAVTSNGSGVINLVIGNNPSVYVDWSNIAALYHEYRVLSLSVDFIPQNKYNQAAAAPAIVSVVDHSTDVNVMTSYDTTIQFQSAKWHSLNDNFGRRTKMTGPDEAVFTPITTGVNTFSVKFYADGCANSTTYGRVFATALVQFQNQF